MSEEESVLEPFERKIVVLLRDRIGARRPTLEHVLDEDTALNNVTVGDELLVVGGDEENHGDFVDFFEMEEVVVKD
jgi:hypothetical protein